MDVKPGYKQTDVGLIPEEWGIFELEETARVVDSLHQTPSFAEDGYPMVRVTDIKPGNLRFIGTLMVTEAVFAEFTKNYKPKRGDIVLSRVGSYGVSSFVETDEPFCMGQNTVVLQPKLPPRFLYYVLNSHYIRQQIEDGSYGSGYKSLSLKNIKELRIPVPPTEVEQTAIAEALSDADALIEALEQLIAKKRQIKQGALQELLTGKRRLPGFSGEWETKRLGDIGEIDPENLTSNTNPNYAFKYISLEDVDVGILRNSTEMVFMSAPSRARRIVCKRDILISTVRPNLKSHLFFQDDVTDMICSTGFSVLRCNLKIAYPAYVFFHLFAYQVERQIETLLTGSNYPAINSNDVRALQIPFPSLEEQTAIAEILSDMDAEIASLDAKLAKVRKVKQGMMQELLAGGIRLI